MKLEIKNYSYSISFSENECDFLIINKTVFMNHVLIYKR